MMLISLLLVLAIERVVVKTPVWQIDTYLSRYLTWLNEKQWISASADKVVVWLMMLLPALLLTIIETWLLGPFLTFIEQTFVLFLCVGCPALRETYKCFLQAAGRGDLEACSLYSEQLGHCTDDDSEDDAKGQGKSFGQHLMWLNYQYYAAVILWFLAFGAPGVLFYGLVRYAYNQSCELQDGQSAKLAHLMFALDFIPVRIVTFGLLMMGHFSRALPVWIQYLPDVQTSSEKVLTNVASQAEMLTPEELEQQQSDAAIEPKVLVKLAKRNILFLLVVTSVLTLAGALA